MINTSNNLSSHRRYIGQDCKPGSVSDDYLSGTAVTGSLKPCKEQRRAALIAPKLLRIGFTREFSYHLPCELLPHISTLTAPRHGVYFLLHCPWSRLRRPLAGILPCEARTFLMAEPRNRLTYSHMLLYSNFFCLSSEKNRNFGEGLLPTCISAIGGRSSPLPYSVFL